MFYHIKNLQSTKTGLEAAQKDTSFITLRIYKVLKRVLAKSFPSWGFITLRIYKVLKQAKKVLRSKIGFITLRIYKVLKPLQ